RLDGTLLVEIVVPEGRRPREALRHLAAVADLVDVEDFRLEIRPPGEKERRRPRDEELPVEARRGAQGARPGGPGQVIGGEAPAEPDAREELRAGVAV